MQEMTLRMPVVKRVFVREAGQVVVVQRMGLEPRPWGSARRGQTRRRRNRRNPIQATAAKMAGLPEGAAIARRQQLRREAIAPIKFSRRGTLRAVSGRSRLIRRNGKSSGRMPKRRTRGRAWRDEGTQGTAPANDAPARVPITESGGETRLRDGVGYGGRGRERMAARQRHVA